MKEVFESLLRSSSQPMSPGSSPSAPKSPLGVTGHFERRTTLGGRSRNLIAYC
jgi:hypothetical protein